MVAVMIFVSLLPCAGNSETTGEPAPEFRATDVSGQTVRLSDFKERKNVLLVFYWNHT